MKIAALWEVLHPRPEFQPRLIHTGQHFSPEMSQFFFDNLGLPQPDVRLEIGPGSATAQTAAILVGLESEWARHRPDAVVVVGDVTSTAAAALVAARLGIPAAHVEAGLRSFDREMPEELNRLITDSLCEFLFASEQSGVDNLKAEGIAGDRIFFAGNVMIDTLLRFRHRAGSSRILEQLGARPGSYALATLHRPSNVDDSQALTGLVAALTDLAGRMPVIFPVHPRTRQRLESFGLSTGAITMCDPLGYLDFVRLMEQARLVLTDSGGIQEETTVLGVPCLTLRNNTERPATLTHGTNKLIGNDPARILEAAEEILAGHAVFPQGPPAGWDGRAGVRIAEFLLERLSGAARA